VDGEDAVVAITLSLCAAVLYWLLTSRQREDPSKELSSPNISTLHIQHGSAAIHKKREI
jgi:hypothetical protein